MSKNRIPNYRLHKATGQAVVVLRGRSVYLGKFDTPESRAKYDRVMARYLAGRADPEHPATESASRPTTSATRSADLSVAELVLRYWGHAKTYYTKNGRPTGELYPLKQALRVLRRHFGETPATEFGPLSLKALRDVMITLPITRKVKVVDPDTHETRFEEKVIRVGLARRTINKQLGRVKRCFAWAVGEELLPARVHDALLRVDGLRKGRSAAREAPPVRPAPDADVDAALSRVPAAVRAMIEVQRLTGCRPQEVVTMRGADIDTAGPVWEYRPPVYKTEHRDEGGGERVICIGPRAQVVLAPLLTAARGGYLFRPGRPDRDRKAGAPAGKPAEHYTVAGYRQEIRRGCVRAKVPRWCPNQLRHAAGTSIRKKFGLERAQAVLGHRELGVTQVYAEVDREAARVVMAEVG